MTDIDQATRELQEALNQLVYQGATIEQARQAANQHLDKLSELNDPNPVDIREETQ